MCGIVGIAGVNPVNQSIYDALTVLQHRGQDAAGIATIDENNGFRLRKANGLVKDVFETRHMLRLKGTIGIGHVRYPTAGSSSASEAQPFYVNSPFGITLAHNGNLTNAHLLRRQLFETARRHINTTSDSEILLNVLAYELDRFDHFPLEPDNIFTAVAAMHKKLRGAYACVALIIGHGLLAFRDPYGIRPLVLGKRTLEDGRSEYMVASESVALDTLGFEFLRDVAPGEAVYITEQGQLFTRQCAENPQLVPCLFEYVYFASAAPEVRFPNVYGIDMPNANELIAHGREVDEIRKLIGADGLIFQDLSDLIAAVQEENPDINQFECSVFDGVYITKDIDQGYLDYLENLRRDDEHKIRDQHEAENLEIYNEG